MRGFFHHPPPFIPPHIISPLFNTQKKKQPLIHIDNYHSWDNVILLIKIEWAVGIDRINREKADDYNFDTILRSYTVDYFDRIIG